MSAAATSTDGPTGTAIPFGEDRALICRARQRLCALRLGDVVETLRPLALQGLAGMPAFVTGLSVLRGVAVPVVDVGALLGAADRGVPTRLVAIRAGGRSIALAFESVLGIRALPPTATGALPPLMGEASREAIAAVGTLDAELLVVLRAARAIPEAAWDLLQLGPAAPS